MALRIGVVIPVKNCLDYTQNAIASLRTRHPYQTYIVDDHSDEPMKSWLAAQTRIATITDPNTPGLAANWNLGIRKALDEACAHVLIANNDILFHPTTVDVLAARLGRGDCVLVSADDKSSRCKIPADIFRYIADDLREMERPDFACFMINQRTIDLVGWFDENYHGAYYEDNDYEAQIAMSGQRALSIHGAPYYHYGSRTADEHRHLLDGLQRGGEANRRYFIRKWGRPPSNDYSEMRKTFHTPTES